MEENSILDASVIVAALTEESQAAKSLISNGMTHFIMEHTVLEVVNAILNKSQDQETSKKVLDSFWALELEQIKPYSYDLNFAYKLAKKTGATIYDSLYHAVALTADYTFYTFDKKYFAQASYLGNIELLEEEINS